MSGKELHLKAIHFNLEVILRYCCFLIRPEFPIKICICSCTKLSLSSYHILSYISIVKIYEAILPLISFIVNYKIIGNIDCS